MKERSKEMAHILIAATSDDVAAMERILGRRHDSIVVVSAMSEALEKLKEKTFDRIKNV
jgi:hypothetical protein